ncbi:Flp family type IVb pilin [Nocardioides sp.]|uniref:Flp family type IVb pilin n=1 Tax=Nocardioides sp. TaxID=35761 RepID=UPI00351140FB
MLQTALILLQARKSEMNERGASAVEYGLLVAGIAALIIVAVFLLGNNLSGLFNDTANSIG